MSTPNDSGDPGGDYVDVVHVAGRSERGVFTAAQAARCAVLIRDAESVLRVRIPGIDERVTSESPAPPDRLAISEVQRVVAQAVLRVMEPGRGMLSQRAAGEGPFNESRTYATSSSGTERTGGVQFTAEELDDLRASSSVPAGFGVVHQSIPAWRVP